MAEVIGTVQHQVVQVAAGREVLLFEAVMYPQFHLHKEIMAPLVGFTLDQLHSNPTVAGVVVAVVAGLEERVLM